MLKVSQKKIKYVYILFYFSLSSLWRKEYD